MLIRMKDLEPGETLGDRVEEAVRATICEQVGHDVTCESSVGPDSGEEWIYCKRCGADLGHNIYY